METSPKLEGSLNHEAPISGGHSAPSSPQILSESQDQPSLAQVNGENTGEEDPQASDGISEKKDAEKL